MFTLLSGHTTQSIGSLRNAPLDLATCASFEARFGYDLSEVRMHNGGWQASKLAGVCRRARSPLVIISYSVRGYMRQELIRGTD